MKRRVIIMAVHREFLALRGNSENYDETSLGAA